jgi:hypothetical protein
MYSIYRLLRSQILSPSLCLCAALAVVGCSTRDSQREKDRADRQAVAGVWSSETARKSFLIMGFSPDGSFWASNTYGLELPVRVLTATGTWNVINGRLVFTNGEVAYLNWGARQRPQFPPVESSRIVRVSDQELALALDDKGSNTHILHKWIESNLRQSSSAFEKATQINLSVVKFDGLPLADVITMLHDESVRCDAAQSGVAISLGPDAKPLADAEINLDLRDVTLAEALERVVESVGLEVQATEFELVLVRKKAKQ